MLVKRMQLEEIVSKRRSSPYRSGECKDWRKIKTAGCHKANQSGGASLTGKARQMICCGRCARRCASEDHEVTRPSLS